MTRLASRSKDLVLPFCTLATFAYVLFWLTRHSFMEQPHHYVTALVIVGWSAGQLARVLSRALSERVVQP